MLKKFFRTRIFRLAVYFAKRLRKHNLSEYSAYSVMFIILSFVPFLVLLLNILKALPVFDGTQGYRITGSDEFTEYLKNLFGEADRRANGAFLSFTTILSLWSASRGLIGIINGLNRIHNAKESRGFIKLRLYSIAYTLLMMAVIIVILVILIFGEAIIKQTQEMFSLTLISENGIFSFRWIIGFCALVVFFTLFYCALPIQKSKPLSKLPGALFCAGGWIGFSVVYSLYVRHFADFPYLYGSLSLPVTAILWLYICIYMLFLGEEINIVLDKRHLKRISKAFS